MGISERGGVRVREDILDAGRWYVRDIYWFVNTPKRKGGENTWLVVCTYDFGRKMVGMHHWMLCEAAYATCRQYQMLQIVVFPAQSRSLGSTQGRCKEA
jgi:hypothetical protein